MKRNRILFVVLLVLTPAVAGAQDGIGRVLRAIAENSTALDVLAKTTAAEQAANRTGLTLPAPELGFNYLFGSHAGMGRRQDYSVNQAFDAATLSGAKRRLADGLDSVAASRADVARTALLLEAKKQCIEVVYENQVLALTARRQQAVGRLADLVARQAERGGATALEANNVRLNLASVEADRVETTARRDALVADLTRLNGGRRVELTDTAYGTPPLPADFAAWRDGTLGRWPSLRVAKAEVDAAEHARRLTRMERLPELSLGFMQETTPGEAWRGVTVGIALPLWSNRGKKRKAAAEAAAAEARRNDAEVQLRATLEGMYAKTAALVRSADLMGRAVAGSSNVALLARALEAGQLSQIDCLQELDRYYDLALRQLQMRRDAELAKAELTAAEL